ncbi:hypothetical protein RhiirA1_487250 [Rhizophagus irregularis]|uniref:Uncharacterized protein n=1 Tax=Rhizophagus irregularis TaxID=588596 RepID=A0A2N0QGG4_9GLOM|nr:hypothetical protein RhiirA1_487250 [Rhizophagus irregularis]
MIHQQDYSFMDFKFKGILGEGRSGKMLLCEFRGNTITLERRLVEGSIVCSERNAEGSKDVQRSS